MIEKVRSADGTEIAFERSGTGPVVVLVSGATCTRHSDAPHAELLSERFTVLNYDRRGRGDSGDTEPYAPQREIEDLAAVIAAGDGPACVLGFSSGAAIALDAAAAGVPIDKLALWEAPFSVDDPEAPARAREEIAEIQSLLAEGRHGDVVAQFFMKTGMPESVVAQMRQQPWWQGIERIAHTLVYDYTFMADGLVPERYAALETPTLVLGGGESHGFLELAVQATAKAVPGADLRIVAGQNHGVQAEALAPIVTEFFAT
ncbi:alpha/beta hydrolase [Actinomadura barringtoniae]|uniref:Alpha/beta hydrolase n=1 Tax=Actinomadura barringtoniae TaxID=1427535 RepID=A0A939T9D9_9ACTN|nr:alpha/beta hydrolase [Actinomadura barringtoniae]MBO2454149.1 alpha/beta hydrolase [Actinomadura barringtoniae]